MTESAQDDVEQTTTTSGFRCELCNKVYTMKKNMKAHMKSHFVPRLYHCDMCSEVFFDAASLQHHMIDHTGKKVHECAACHKLYARKTTLMVHMRLHTNDTLFKCSICGKVNGTKFDLECHMRTHTGEKPFRCILCDNLPSFATRSSLRRHLRIHSGEKPYSCDTCQKRFARKDQYKKHMQTHLEYHCQACDKKFSNFWTFSQHGPCERSDEEDEVEGAYLDYSKIGTITSKAGVERVVSGSDSEPDNIPLMVEEEDTQGDLRSDDGVEWDGLCVGGEETVLQIIVEGNEAPLPDE